MEISAQETLPIRSSNDIVSARQKVRTMAAQLGLSITSQTKIVTAASELARNTLDYGGGGEMIAEKLEQDLRSGMRLTFQDHGPGIANLELALTDGFTTGRGMGLGLSGAKRLCSEFSIESEPEKGTRVSIIQWK